MSADTYTLRRLLRFGIAGAISGFVGFALVEPLIKEDAVTYDLSQVLEAVTQAFTHSFWVFMLFGMVVSLGLALAEEYDSGQVHRIAVRCLRALVVGAVGGGLAGLLGEFIYMLLALLALLGPIGQIIRRSVGWALLGAVIGGAQGVAAGSWKKAALGMLGGLIGGGIGGTMFDIIGAAVQKGTTSRLFAFTTLGLATAFAIALVSELAKQAWIVIASGPKEGREYILTKPVNTIGRDELADIPLFGDQGVARAHANIVLSGGACAYQDLGGGSLINGQPVRQKPLADGDMIRIGRFNLRFRSKGAPGRSPAYVPVSLPDLTRPSQPTATTRLMPRLKVAGGPHAGSSFAVLDYTITIGRDPSSGIALTLDGSVSRRHATLSYENGGYVIRDAGSSNGTFVNGARITESPFAPGDSVQVGASVLNFVVENA